MNPIQHTQSIFQAKDDGAIESNIHAACSRKDLATKLARLTAFSSNRRAADTAALGQMA
jgi:hypothetical protein